MQGDMQEDLGSKLGKGAWDLEKLGKSLWGGPRVLPGAQSPKEVYTVLYGDIPAWIITWQQHTQFSLVGV